MLQALSDPAELRRFIRDLLALSALPAIMKSYNPRQIADTVVEAVESMLDADFMYMSLLGRRDDAVIEIVRTHERRAGDFVDAISTAMRELLPAYSSAPTVAVPNPIGEGAVRIAVAPIGIGGNTVILAASRRTDFPTAAERLLLGIAANEATIALQRWRAETEERIRQTEQELRFVIDTIPALVWSARPDGSIDFGNRRLLEYTGLALEDVRDWVRTAEWHPADAILTEDGRAALAAGQPFNREARLRRADGEYRWFLLHAVPLRDETGRIVRWYGTTTDIEDRKRAEEALRRSEGYLAEAQRLSRTGSFGWNVFTGELFWSEESFRIFGYDRSIKPTLQLVLQRVHPDDLVFVQERVRRVSEEGKDWNLEHRLLMPGGAVRHLHVMARASRDESGNLEFIGAVMDVTTTKRAEDELHRARADLAHVARVTTLGELTASIAHEVNQPVAAMKINANAGLRWLATQPPDLGEARQALGGIIEEATRAREVIDRIRALASKAPPRNDRLDVNDIVRDVIALTRSEVQRNRVALQTGLAGDLPPISGDRVQLQQVVLNLIINAIEALNEASDGPRELLVGTGKNGSDGVFVAVSDSGPGLDTKHLDHIFDAFHTTKPNGLGMGLAISRSIIEAHGGRLWATPNDRRGAIFQFSLPTNGEDVSRSKRT
ncbi:MAG TPA: PAS domain-containing protein [Terriglobales bacterium]|nr:PAS domain-containing protein [Terriglobales bacterium]